MQNFYMHIFVAPVFVRPVCNYSNYFCIFYFVRVKDPDEKNLDMFTYLKFLLISFGYRSATTKLQHSISGVL